MCINNCKFLYLCNYSIDLKLYVVLYKIYHKNIA